MEKVKEITIYQHNSLFLSLIDNLINKVHIFGLHFATLDMRQDSSIHGALLNEIASKEKVLPENYVALSDDKKIEALTCVHETAHAENYEGVLKDTLDFYCCH